MLCFRVLIFVICGLVNNISKQITAFGCSEDQDHRKNAFYQVNNTSDHNKLIHAKITVNNLYNKVFL